MTNNSRLGGFVGAVASLVLVLLAGPTLAQEYRIPFLGVVLGAPVAAWRSPPGLNRKNQTIRAVYTSAMKPRATSCSVCSEKCSNSLMACSLIGS